MKKNKTIAKQLLLDGREEAPAKGSKSVKAGFVEFMRVSSEEHGLLAPAQAAMVLDISPARVFVLLEEGKLKRFEFFGRPYLSAREVNVRRHADVKAGRPPRDRLRRAMMVGKVNLQNDLPQNLEIILNK